MSPPALSMDEQKPLASSDSGTQGSVEARFADFCKVVAFSLYLYIIHLIFSLLALNLVSVFFIPVCEILLD